MNGLRRMLTGGWVVGALLTVLAASPVPVLHARWARHLVVSEVYGGGGNKGAAYGHDFIELYNPTGQPVSLEGWSIQYASARGTFTPRNVVPLQGVIPAFGTYLIQAAAGSAGEGAPLPAPDAESSVSLAASAGQVALAHTVEPLTGPDDPRLVDLVGYGNAERFEGEGPAPGGSSSRSLQRRGDGGADPGSGTGGGWDTGQNALDWTSGPPTPRNSLAPPEPPAPPLARIRPLPVALPGEAVELDGTGSQDPGGDPLAYRWRLTERPPESTAVLTDPESPRTTLLPDRPGTYRVELVVTDGLLESAPASATLQVRAEAASLITHGPNPARTRVTFFYQGREPATLRVYDAAGRLVHQAPLHPGPYEHPWALLTDRGRPVAPGLYLYLVVMEGGDRSSLQRLVVSR